ncbi:MAG: ABC transporter permease [Acutalibacteraceae bacterium]
MKESLIILKKELLEIFRDRSTFIIMLIPVLIFPIFNTGLSYINKNSESKIDVSIQCNSLQANQVINDFIESAEMVDIKIINTEAPKELLKNGKIDCIITETDESIDFIYNSSSFNSLSITTKLAESFQEFYTSFLSSANNGVYSVNLKDESNNNSDTVNSVSRIFIPIMLVMLAFQCTSSFANDIFCGEKERKTLELLFLSGIKRESVYFGKISALLILGETNLIFGLLSYFITFSFSENGLRQFKFMQSENKITCVLGIVFTMLMLELISVFLSFSVSMISKNMKNAQILNEIVLAVPIGISILLTTGIINCNISIIKYIPVFNLIVSLNNSFAGIVNTGNIIFACLSNSIFIVVSAILGIRYIKTEKIFN